MKSNRTQMNKQARRCFSGSKAPPGFSSATKKKKKKKAGTLMKCAHYARECVQSVQHDSVLRRSTRLSRVENEAKKNLNKDPGLLSTWSRTS